MAMRKILLTLPIWLPFLTPMLGLGAFGATEHVITQKGRAFSAATLTVKKGDTVLFVNDDTVSHNTMSLSPGNDFNLGSQPPGTATPVTFNELGDVNVICAIHPLMKMTVKVTQ